MQASLEIVEEKLQQLDRSELLKVHQLVEALQHDRELANAYTKLSDPSFEAVWNNDEDAVYDKL